MFGDIDAQATAERKIEKLRAYTTEFRQAASHLTWGDAQAFKFHMGLKEAVKDRIGRPSGLAELMQLLVRIDDGLYARKKRPRSHEKQSGGQHTPNPPLHEPTTNIRTDGLASQRNEPRPKIPATTRRKTAKVRTRPMLLLRVQST